jgi:hypothetical protein
MTDDDLIRALRELGASLPDGPDLAPAVLARLDAPARRRGVRPLILAFAALLVVAATAVAASDRLREALFGAGVEIRRVETLPPVETEAGPVIPAPPSLPVSATLGPPDSVRDEGAGTYALLWRRDDPVLLTVTARFDDIPVIGKLLAARTSVEVVTIAGIGDAIWIAGAPHAVTFPDGRVERFRLARNVLIWSDGERTYRLEGSFDRAAAAALAASFGS